MDINEKIAHIPPECKNVRNLLLAFDESYVIQALIKRDLLNIEDISEKAIRNLNRELEREHQARVNSGEL